MDDKFDFDEKKSEWTLKNRGFDFPLAARIFEGFVVEWSSPRDGEDRIAATGIVEGRYLTVIYTWRQGRRRIISARPARRKERNVYDAQKP